VSTILEIMREILLLQNIYKHGDYAEFWGYIWQINRRPIRSWVLI